MIIGCEYLLETKAVLFQEQTVCYFDVCKPSDMFPLSETAVISHARMWNHSYWFWMWGPGWILNPVIRTNTNCKPNPTLSMLQQSTGSAPCMLSTIWAKNEFFILFLILFNTFFGAHFKISACSNFGHTHHSWVFKVDVLQFSFI